MIASGSKGSRSELQELLGANSKDFEHCDFRMSIRSGVFETRTHINGE